MPFMFRPSYERLDVEYFVTTDDLPYGAYYQQYFGEPVTLPSDDVLLVCLMNITKAVFVLIAIGFQGDVDVLRVGVLGHETGNLLYNSELPTGDLAIQLEIKEIGLYSCGVFYSPNGQYSLDVDVIYLS